MFWDYEGSFILVAFLALVGSCTITFTAERCGKAMCTQYNKPEKCTEVFNTETDIKIKGQDEVDSAK